MQDLACRPDGGFSEVREIVSALAGGATVNWRLDFGSLSDMGFV